MCSAFNVGWPPDPSQQTVIIWDGAPWHSKAAIVRQAAEALGFMRIQLPSYSPDLNPIEGLWKWMREELTQPSLLQIFLSARTGLF